MSKDEALSLMKKANLNEKSKYINNTEIFTEKS